MKFRILIEITHAYVIFVVKPKSLQFLKIKISNSQVKI